MIESNTTYPSVSVALCTYNGVRFLKEQLDSILQQDYINIDEIICVDDRSTDETWNILEQYAAKYPAFKIFKNETNLGFIKNYEKAISLCKSSYIAISDQDDIWHTSKISKLLVAIGPNLMVYSDNEYIDQDGKLMGVKFSDKRNIAAITSCLNFALFNVISGHTVLFKKELLNHALPFPADIHYDWWLGFCASQYSAIQVVNEPLVGYRQHSSNAVGSYKSKKDAKKAVSFSITNEAYVRIRCFSTSIAKHLEKEKQILEFLANSYTNKTLTMRFQRVAIYWENREKLLHFKKKSKVQKMLYCFKVFIKYE